MQAAEFSGFPEETFSFLRGLSAHNDKVWFEAHRDLYETGYVAPARAFVAAVGPHLSAISPAVQFAPKINGSIGRINRDIRFSKDKHPYKDHLDLWFWHGPKKGWDCAGFFLRLTADLLIMGTGSHQMAKHWLDRFRAEVSDPSGGKALAETIAGVQASGPYLVAGKTRKRPPRGYGAEGAGAELLLYEGLYATFEWDASVARNADFAEFSVAHWRKMWPIGDWLMGHVMG